MSSKLKDIRLVIDCVPYFIYENTTTMLFTQNKELSEYVLTHLRDKVKDICKRILCDFRILNLLYDENENVLKIELCGHSESFIYDEDFSPIESNILYPNNILRQAITFHMSNEFGNGTDLIGKGAYDGWMECDIDLLQHNGIQYEFGISVKNITW